MKLRNLQYLKIILWAILIYCFGQVGLTGEVNKTLSVKCNRFDGQYKVGETIKIYNLCRLIHPEKWQNQLPHPSH